MYTRGHNRKFDEQTFLRTVDFILRYVTKASIGHLDLNQGIKVIFQKLTTSVETCTEKKILSLFAYKCIIYQASFHYLSY